MNMTTRREQCPAVDADAIAVMRRDLGLSLTESARVSACMTNAELDLIERERSPAAIAAIIYQAQIRAARRIPDPEASRLAVRHAREDARRHGQLVADRVQFVHEEAYPPRDSGPRVYPEPPHSPITADAA